MLLESSEEGRKKGLGFVNGRVIKFKKYWFENSSYGME